MIVPKGLKTDPEVYNSSQKVNWYPLKRESVKKNCRTEKYMFSSSATVYLLHIQLNWDIQFYLLCSDLEKW